jgi:glutamate-1-semialdehyde 2,1-aminomutase
MRELSLETRARAHLPGGNTRTTVFVPPHPPYAVRGRGHLVTDAEGHTVIDLQANMSALVHGHAHPAILAALRPEDGLSFGLPTESEVRLAEHLTDRVRGLERVRFANSGTEAVMGAVRTARAVTGKDTIVRFAGCYHGVSESVMEGRGVPPQHARVVPWGDPAALANVLDDDVAAILVDLMPNRAGLTPAPPEFVAALRDRGDALLIVDEVITFRLDHGGLAARLGVESDLVALGKTIGGGLPVGAFGGREALMAIFDPQRDDPLEHGGTFTANPPTMRAGLAALELLDAAAIDRINALGDALRARLATLGFETRGEGSLTRVTIDDEVWWRLYRAGVLVAHNGLTCISTTMDETTIDEIAGRFASVR